MRTLIFSILLIISALPLFSDYNSARAQGIGEIAPEKPPEIFPPNVWGFDLLIGESGFGFGGFYRKQLNIKFTLFADLSISEAKDEREIEFVDIFGQTFTIGKKNRVFLVPLTLGAQYRLFENELADNLRPYINAGVGPTMALTTPYSEEFFAAFGKAQTHFGVGGYVGFGANFGLDKSNLVGLNIRYYYTKFLGEGVEILNRRFKDDLQGFFISLNFGFMY
jgi:hypothetical protein